MARKPGDRKDGKLLRDIDAMHIIVPMLYPNRCDNEAFISERIDLTKVNAYLESKNASEPEYKYNLFQVIVTAMLKVLTLRPKMNRFIANCNVYQRNEVSASFVVKKLFSDEGAEALAFIHSKGTDNIDTIHNEIFRQVSTCRSDKLDRSSESMEIFKKLPRFITRTAIRGIICRLDKHGWGPDALTAADPFQASVLLANIGSIGLKAGYHHLTNWGTTSVFVVVGKAEMKPFYGENGEVVMKHAVDLGLTIDERLADGYYYAGTVKMIKVLMENPELLERPLGERLPDELFQKIRG